MQTKPIYVITGPTATGKTGKAVALACSIDGEIISADSRQIYRGMDIGSGKDLDEYGDVPYHLIDICNPGYKYNLFEFLRDYRIARDEIWSRGKEVVVCGGTGLYVESILKGIELPQVPENKSLRDSLKDKSLAELTEMLSRMKTLHNTTDVDSVKRAIRAIEIQTYYQEHPEMASNAQPAPEAERPEAVVIGIDIDREARRRRITQRLDARLKEGMVEEVRSLLQRVSAEDMIYYGLEYKFVTQYILGEYSLQEMHDKLEIAIHQFAKRQMTWFRGMERRGIHINWLRYDLDDEEFVRRVKEIAKGQ